MRNREEYCYWLVGTWGLMVNNVNLLGRIIICVFWMVMRMAYRFFIALSAVYTVQKTLRNLWLIALRELQFSHYGYAVWKAVPLVAVDMTFGHTVVNYVLPSCNRINERLHNISEYFVYFIRFRYKRWLLMDSGMLPYRTLGSIFRIPNTRAWCTA